MQGAMLFRDGCGALLLAAVALLTPQPLTAQTLATYDNFNAEEIDGQRWAGTEHVIRYGTYTGGWTNEIENQWTRHPEFSVVNTRVDRRIVGGRLRLLLNTSGGTHDNTVAPGHGRLSLWAKFLWDVVTRVQTSVTVMSAAPQPCRAEGESRARAQLYAEVAKDPVDRVIFATLSLERSSFGGDRIVAVLSRCGQSTDCVVAEDLDWVVFNRSWTAGTAHTLTITHQPANDRVVFAVGGGGVPAETRTLRYGAATDATLVVQGVALRVESSPANCPADGGGPGDHVDVAIDARFDNVRLNASAVR
jgi:hypothetical protein